MGAEQIYPEKRPNNNCRQSRAVTTTIIERSRGDEAQKKKKKEEEEEEMSVIIVTCLEHRVTNTTQRRDKYPQPRDEIGNKMLPDKRFEKTATKHNTPDVHRKGPPMVHKILHPIDLKKVTMDMANAHVFIHEPLFEQCMFSSMRRNDHEKLFRYP